MPIKFPKSFQRRKSSGQALDEVLNPPQTSFRVLERTPDSSKSFDGGHTARRTNEVRPLSEAGALDFQDGRIRPNISPYNRGSGGTQNSTSSGGLFDTSSSSARYSSSSTLPSTTSITGQDEPQPTPLKKTKTAPLPAPARAAPATPSPSFLRAAGRTLSFGTRRMTESATTSPINVDMAHHSMDFSDIPDVPDVNAPLRKRALTETSHASASTATPPKLAESDLNLGLSITEDNDDWGDMFDKLNSHEKRKSVGGQDKKNVGSPVQSSAADRFSRPPSNAPPPPPVHIDRTRNVTPGPLTGTSYNSQEQLISASPVQEDSGFRTRPIHNRNSSSFLKFQHLAGQDSPSSDHHFLSPHESPTFNPRDSVRMSAPILDDEARAVLGYLSPGRKSPSYAPVPTSVPSPPLHLKPSSRRDSEIFLSQRQPLTLHDGENQDYASIADSTSIMTTPRAHRAEPALQDVSLDDLSFREMARSAAQIEAGDHIAPQNSQPKGKKVMTPAEFEQYKEDKERYRDSSEQERTDESDNSEPEDYDDDDEAERTAELTKQRRKQEAKLSVYRQQMMKVTGERNLPSLHPSPNGGSPGLSKRVSSTSLKDRTGAGSKSSAEDDDDDDDIPLGILAAHGFPSKDRPPSHLQRVSSQPNIRYMSETYPTPPIPPLPGSSNNLPVFARNLPKDPYYGASLVNAPIRESMGFNSGAASVYGGSQHGGAPSNVPPGGLVGIIAQEERAKALRRGTPGSRSFDATNQAAGLPLPPSMMPQAQMQMHPPQPVVSPDQQAQMQMNQQMTQMMQMQMQWMSQMMHMQGMGQTPQMPQMPMMQQSMSMPQMPTLAQMQAAQSKQSASGPGTPGGFLNVPNAGPRPASNGSQFGNFQQQQQPQGLAQNPVWQGSRASLAQSQMLGNRTSTMPANAGYAHSIAPSERSNIGQPSRYRPVSTMGETQQPPTISGRASTMGTNAYKAWESRPMSQSSLATSQTPTQAKPKPAATIRPVIPRIVDDEDEDEGWEEMRKKREGKKKIWKGKKAEKGGETGLEGVFYPTDIN